MLREKERRALALRDAALALLKRRGKWLTLAHTDPPMKILTASVGQFREVMYREFTKVPLGGKNLLYGLDIWAPKKVLNVEWNDQGKFEVVAFHPGDWEEELIATRH